MENQTVTHERGPETILVVEDEESLLGLVDDFLRGEGYKVITARDGLEAAESYATHRESIGLVMTDMGLPKLGGKDLLKRLHQINPNARIIMSSGYFEPALKTEMINAGANAFIPKPFALVDVLNTVRNVLDSGS